jgi:hypothetical protein
VTGTDLEPSAIDVLFNMAYRNGPPHEQLKWLRYNQPLFDQTIDDPIMVGNSYVVTRHADIVSVSRDLDHFGNAGGHTSAMTMKQQA